MSPYAISGYVVVDAPKIGARYRGIDRQPWELVDLHYCTKVLPPEVLYEYSRMQSLTTRGLWWPVCSSAEVAERLLAYSEEEGRPSEVVAVWSPYLDTIHGSSTLDGEQVVPIGVDVVAVGEWSLLGALEDCDAIEGVRALLNSYGLLSDAANVGVVEDAYRALVKEGVVEPIADAASGLPVEGVAVFLVTRQA